MVRRGLGGGLEGGDIVKSAKDDLTKRTKVSQIKFRHERCPFSRDRGDHKFAMEGGAVVRSKRQVLHSPLDTLKMGWGKAARKDKKKPRAAQFWKGGRFMKEKNP